MVIEAFPQRHPVTWIRQPDIGMYDVLNKGPCFVTRRRASEARVQTGDVKGVLLNARRPDCRTDDSGVGERARVNASFGTVGQWRAGFRLRISVY